MDPSKLDKQGFSTELFTNIDSVASFLFIGSIQYYLCLDPQFNLVVKIKLFRHLYLKKIRLILYFVFVKVLAHTLSH